MMTIGTKHLRLAILLLSFVAFSNLYGQEWSEKRLQNLYVEFLTTEGYRPSVDSDGDVTFKSEGLTYFIDVDEDDSEYFAIMLANIWEVESAQERIEVLEACNQVSSTAKVIKGQIINDNVWITCEMFVADPEDFKGVFDRAMSALSAAQTTFVEAMN